MYKIELSLPLNLGYWGVHNHLRVASLQRDRHLITHRELLDDGQHVLRALHTLAAHCYNQVPRHRLAPLVQLVAPASSASTINAVFQAAGLDADFVC
jgi:hypothetical protein